MIFIPIHHRNADLAVINLDGTIVLRILTGKGEEFVKKIPAETDYEDNNLIQVC